MDALHTLIHELPKVELHIHIEGSLEPEMMFALAQRNGIDLPYATVDDVRAAYDFADLQAFLDLYYAGAAVLITEDDFADLMAAYLQRAAADGVRHAEIFFDPQTHTERGVKFATVMNGFIRAQEAASDTITSSLILCFLRHLSANAAMEVLDQAGPWLDRIEGVGLDSSEVGFPPELFAEPFRAAVAAGLRPVAHAGEEGPASYVSSALDVLKVERIDHGVRAEDDPALVQRLAAEQIPLTMCPLSNQRLQVTPDLSTHNLKRLMDAGVLVTVNSDDPSYFGGYVAANYIAIADALSLSADDVVLLARNSVDASFLDDTRKAALHDEITAVAADHAT